MHHDYEPDSLRTRTRITGAAACLLALLVGCGGGSGDQPDPVILDYPIAYIERTPPVDEDGDPLQVDAQDPAAFNPGARLIVRDRATANAPAREISARAFAPGALYDVKDLEIIEARNTEDLVRGYLILFAMRAPEIMNADPQDQPTWNLWVYDLERDRLKRVIADGATAEEGQDMAPAVLPDGRVVFVSSRQRETRRIALDEAVINGIPKDGAATVTEGNVNDDGFEDIALVLHILDVDCREYDSCQTTGASAIEQISFNQSHDLDPTVLDDGRILFTRWDNAGGSDEMNLYTVNADGTRLQILYGSYSHDTGSDPTTPIQFLQPQPTADGRVLTVARPFTGTWGGGDLLLIDTANFADNQRPTYTNLGAIAGPAQQSATQTTVRSDLRLSTGGRYAYAFPLWDDRLLVSYSDCFAYIDEGQPTEQIRPCALVSDLSAANVTEAPARYGLWMLDPAGGNQLPIVPITQGTIISEVVAPQPGRQRGFPASAPRDPSLVQEGLGALHIRSVYDFGDETFDGCFFGVCAPAGVNTLEDLADPAQALASERPARFLRIEKAVAIPDEDTSGIDLDTSAYGVSTANGMREIVGYAPIEPDGSVYTYVPAEVPLTIAVLDADGRRIGPRHDNWLQVRSGETLNCVGCHDAGRAPANTIPMPHGRADAEAPSINAGAPITGYTFPNTDATLFADFADTMALVRARTAASSLPAADPQSLSPYPSLDLIYDDIWTDETAAGRVKDASVAWRYDDIDPTLTVPASVTCRSAWESACRSVINYEQHIHPMWSLDRGANTCVACHTNVDPMNGNAMVPLAQLDLGNGPSDLEADHFKSYRELLSPDQGETLNAGGMLVPITIQVPLLDADGNPVLDAMGNPILVDVPDPSAGVTPSMSTAGARSSRFFDVFDAGGTHAGFLSGAELKMLAEWLDVGAQYYNNPFEPGVPTN